MTKIKLSEVQSSLSHDDKTRLHRARYCLKNSFQAHFPRQSITFETLAGYPIMRGLNGYFLAREGTGVALYSPNKADW